MYIKQKHEDIEKLLRQYPGYCTLATKDIYDLLGEILRLQDQVKMEENNFKEFRFIVARLAEGKKKVYNSDAGFDQYTIKINADWADQVMLQEKLGK